MIAKEKKGSLQHKKWNEIPERAVKTMTLHGNCSGGWMSLLEWKCGKSHLTNKVCSQSLSWHLTYSTRKKKVLETNLFGRNSEFCNKLYCLFIGCLQSIFKHISEKICRKIMATWYNPWERVYIHCHVFLNRYSQIWRRHKTYNSTKM